MASIKDVARKAGVSIATVSNVFNDAMKVKDATRAKVLLAAAELNYGGTGNSNVKATSKIIGVITEDITEFNTPEIIHSIGQYAKERGWDIITMNLGILRSEGTYDFDEMECISLARNAVNILLSKGISGIIYIACKNREIRYLSDGYSTPFVYAYCYAADKSIPSIIYENEKIAYELAQYLIDNGHTKIGIISELTDNVQAQSRLVGIQRAHFDAGILYNPDNIQRGDWNDANSGFKSVQALLKHDVTAVICLNDIIASGVYDYAFTSGIRIPDELSVVGFDNQMFAQKISPKLTTVDLPLNEIGYEAMLQIVRLVTSKEDKSDSNLFVIPCKLIIRDSVANRKS